MAEWRREERRRVGVKIKRGNMREEGRRSDEGALGEVVSKEWRVGGKGGKESRGSRGGEEGVEVWEACKKVY